jgi:hypothetical protein
MGKVESMRIEDLKALVQRAADYMEFELACHLLTIAETNDSLKVAVRDEDGEEIQAATLTCAGHLGGSWLVRCNMGTDTDAIINAIPKYLCAVLMAD